MFTKISTYIVLLCIKVPISLYCVYLGSYILVLCIPRFLYPCIMYTKVPYPCIMYTKVPISLYYVYLGSYILVLCIPRFLHPCIMYTKVPISLYYVYLCIHPCAKVILIIHTNVSVSICFLRNIWNLPAELS